MKVVVAFWTPEHEGESRGRLVPMSLEAASNSPHFESYCLEGMRRSMGGERSG